MPKAPTDIRSLARSHTESALNVLKGIMEQIEAAPAARVAAAVALLDRGWGKPMQSVTVEDVTSKVIRSPAVAPTAEAWSKDHHTEH